ncbi:MAG: PaaI family thioesterase [Pseudomonadota bacterium]
MPSDDAIPAGLPTFEPANPDYAGLVTASFGRQNLMQSFGATLGDVAPGRVMIIVSASDAVGQQQGYIHGGVIGAIADSAAGYASLSLMAAGSEVVTVEYKINFLKPAAGRSIEAIGHVLRAGRSLTVARADVHCEGTQIALLQGTFMRVSAS